MGEAGRGHEIRHPHTNVIEVAIRRLRLKIDDNHEQKLIHTVRGTGIGLFHSADITLALGAGILVAGALAATQHPTLGTD